MKSGGELIKLCREFRGYTQRVLAKKAGVAYSTISNAETGKHEPTFFTVICCLNACGFDLDLVTMEARKK